MDNNRYLIFYNYDNNRDEWKYASGTFYNQIADYSYYNRSFLKTFMGDNLLFLDPLEIHKTKKEGVVNLKL